MENVKFIKALIGATEENIRLGRSMRRLEDNIQMYIEETECEGVEWIQPA
jgi:hypothetical protein